MASSQFRLVTGSIERIGTGDPSNVMMRIATISAVGERDGVTAWDIPLSVLMRDSGYFEEVYRESQPVHGEKHSIPRFYPAAMDTYVKWSKDKTNGIEVPSDGHRGHVILSACIIGDEYQMDELYKTTLAQCKKMLTDSHEWQQFLGVSDIISYVKLIYAQSRVDSPLRDLITNYVVLKLMSAYGHIEELDEIMEADKDFRQDVLRFIQEESLHRADMLRLFISYKHR